jgi:hypothetical protein
VEAAYNTRAVVLMAADYTYAYILNDQAFLGFIPSMSSCCGTKFVSIVKIVSL